MPQQEQYSAIEKELIQGLLDTSADGSHQASVGICPSPSDLRRFEGGKYGRDQEEREVLMSHLAVCDHCVDFMIRLKRRRDWRRRSAIVLASAAVVLIAIWTISQRPTATFGGVAMIDLRLSSPTRGIEKTEGSAAGIVHRDVGRMQLILPPGSEGSYEFELLPYGQETPVIRGSAQATVDGERIILNLSARFGGFAPGEYLLALRRAGSEWAYYKLIFE